MRAVGFLCGIGSILREAEDLGLDVVGNIDTRSYFRVAPWAWDLNFPNAPFLGTEEQLEDSSLTEGWKGADIALGHPPCGAYSVLGNSAARVERFTDSESRAAWHQKRRKSQGMLPFFFKLVRKFKPKAFAFDNLPRMLQAMSEEQIAEKLKRYSLTFLTIVNRDFGSCQNRKRLWVIGVRCKKQFVFKPPHERLPGPVDTWDAIKDLPWEPWVDCPEIAHVHHDATAKPIGGYWARSSGGERFAIQDMIRYSYGFLRMKPGGLWAYENNHGRYVHKPARARLVLGRPARTPSGNETLNHPFTGWPLTIRERARLMGWPDDFRLSDEDHPLNRPGITRMVRLTGRAVPNEFPRFLIPQLVDHVRKHV